MKNKLTLTGGKVITCLILTCFLLVQSCRKDLIQPNSKGIENGLSIAEAKRFFEANLKQKNTGGRVMATKTSGVTSEESEINEILNSKQALWESAYETLISTGGAVKIPLDFGKTYVVTDVAKKELIPFGALNYLFMYKDSLQKIHSEWVILAPDKSWLHGDRKEYTGKIIVKDWNGNFIKSYDHKGGVPGKTMGLGKNKSLGSTSGSEFIPTAPSDPPIDPADPYVTIICITKCHEFCGSMVVDSRKCWMIRNDGGDGPGGDSGGGGGGTGGGGNGNGPSSGGGYLGGIGGGTYYPDYVPPSCNPDPNYVIPSYPAPSGYHWIMPCMGSGSIPLPSEPILETFDENAPIVVPDDFEVTYTQNWFDNEDELGAVGAALALEGLFQTDPVPESYYMQGTGIDMTNAKPDKGLTVFNAPRNPTYFWKELFKKRPEMFSKKNRDLVTKTPYRSPTIDEQWVKYNPTHKAFMDDRLVHHHHEQGKIAYAIPERVHVKWTSILHIYRKGIKINQIKGKLNSLGGVLQVFSSLLDIKTGNPNAWINWFGSQDDTGKLYKDLENGVYWEITSQKVYRDSSGKVIRAIITYNVYDDFVWDEDEKKYMGFPKLGTFTEDVDVVNKKSTRTSFN